MSASVPAPYFLKTVSNESEGERFCREILGFLVATELQRFLGFCDGRSGEKDGIFHFLGLSFEPKPSISSTFFSLGSFCRSNTWDLCYFFFLCRISFSELLLKNSTVLVPNLYKFLSFGSGQLGLVGFYLGMMGIFGSSTKCRICRVWMHFGGSFWIICGKNWIFKCLGLLFSGFWWIWMSLYGCEVMYCEFSPEICVFYTMHFLGLMVYEVLW